MKNGLELRAQRREPSHWQGASYRWLFTQIHFTHVLSTWELEHITGLTMLGWHLDGSHVESPWQALFHSWQAVGQTPKLPPWGTLGILRGRAWALILWPQSQWAFKHSLACHEWLLWLVSPPWYFTLSMATLHLLKLLISWRLMKLSIVCQALDEFYYLQVSNSWKLQVWALNSSLL